MPKAKAVAPEVLTEPVAEKPKKTARKAAATPVVDKPGAVVKTKTGTASKPEPAPKVAAKAAEKPKAAKPVVAPAPQKKTTADFLKEALAAKKASTGVGQIRLRPDMGNAKASKDAERRFGKSRKVH